MKKTLSALMLCLVSLTSFGENYGTWHSSLFKKDYTVELSASTRKPNSFNLTIGAEAEHSSTTINIFLEGESEVTRLREALIQIRDKYVEWKQIAIDNDVTEMNKEIGVSLPPVTVAWYGSKWWFSFNQRFTPKFNISDGKYYVSIFKTLKSSSNEYITEKFYMFFSDVEDFNSLIELLDMDKINNYLHKTDDVENLFK